MARPAKTRDSAADRRARPRGAPQVTRPVIPGYGISQGLEGVLSWTRVYRVLLAAPRFWIATTDSDGRPHVIQQWGTWVDGRYYLEGGLRTKWARNLQRDPRIAVSVERARLAIMAEGLATQRRTVSPELAKQIVNGYAATHSYRPNPKNWQNGGLWEVTPTKVFAWKYADFAGSATRFLFHRIPR